MSTILPVTWDFGDLPFSTVLIFGKQDTGKTTFVKSLWPEYNPPTSPFGLARTVEPLQVPVRTPLGQLVLWDAPALDRPEPFAWADFIKVHEAALVILMTDGDLAPVDVRVQKKCSELKVPIWLVRNKADRGIWDFLEAGLPMNGDMSFPLSRFRAHVLGDMFHRCGILAVMPVYLVDSKHPEEYDFPLIKKMLSITR